MRRSSQTITGSRSGDCTLVIMAKAPKPGMVKTRLAQSLPLAAVVELYRCLLDDTMALARSLDDVQVAERARLYPPSQSARQPRFGRSFSASSRATSRAGAVSR